MFVPSGSSLLLVRLVSVVSLATAIIIQPLAQAQEKITLELSGDGKQLQAQWMGQTHIIEAKTLTANVLDALDCSRLEKVEQLSLSGQRFIGAPTVDLNTGNIAVGVLLSECVETQQSAVFVIKPQPSGYTTSLLKIPGKRPIPNNSSTYALRSLSLLQYWDGLLLVRQGDAAGNQALLVYRQTEASIGEYKGCIAVETIEGFGLCPSSKEN